MQRLRLAQGRSPQEGWGEVQVQAWRLSSAPSHLTAVENVHQPQGCPSDQLSLCQQILMWREGQMVPFWGLYQVHFDLENPDSGPLPNKTQGTMGEQVECVLFRHV